MFSFNNPRRILVRTVNWVGDAVMTLVAFKALVETYPNSCIEVLAKPWVSAIYTHFPGITSVFTLDNTVYSSIKGKIRLINELIKRDYDLAILMQNAFEAAYIVWQARIPIRVGYNTDGRRFFLTHPVKYSFKVRRMHEADYYLNMLYRAGIINRVSFIKKIPPKLFLDPLNEFWAKDFLLKYNFNEGSRLLGIAPGGIFGSAKRWPTVKFIEVIRVLLRRSFNAVLIFGSFFEISTAIEIFNNLKGKNILNLAGVTTLGQVLALFKYLSLLITNDSGLMHAAAALGVPTVAIFGSTNFINTAPLGPWVSVINKSVSCSPCFKTRCPTDLRCFTSIMSEEVIEVAEDLMSQYEK